MPLDIARQDSFLGAASALPAYSGWSPDDIRSNVTEVLSSGDEGRIAGLSSALGGLDAYGGWESQAISQNLSEIFVEPGAAAPSAPAPAPAPEPAGPDRTGILGEVLGEGPMAPPGPERTLTEAAVPDATRVDIEPTTPPAETEEERQLRVGQEEAPPGHLYAGEDFVAASDDPVAPALPEREETVVANSRNEASRKPLVGVSARELRNLAKSQGLEGDGEVGTAGWLASLPENQQRLVLDRSGDNVQRTVNQQLIEDVAIEERVNPFVSTVAGISESVPGSRLLRKGIASLAEGTVGKVPGAVGKAGRSVATNVRAVDRMVDQARKENPELFVGGQISGTVLQSIGMAGLVGKGLQTVPWIAKSKFLTSALTRTIVAGGLSGARTIDDLTEGKVALGDALFAAARGAGAGFVSVIPEVYAPAGALQLLAQPLADLAYDAWVGSAVGENVVSAEWMKQELLNLAIAEGFSIRDVASGAKFKVLQGAQRAEIKGWIKGKGKEGFAVVSDAKVDEFGARRDELFEPVADKLAGDALPKMQPGAQFEQPKPGAGPKQPTLDIAKPGDTKPEPEFKAPATPQELAKVTENATKNLTESTSKSPEVDAADKIGARVLKKFEGTTEPENTAEILDPTLAFVREAQQPGVSDKIRKNTEALADLSHDEVMDMPTRPIYVNSIYRLASLKKPFSIVSVDFRNLGGLNDFFEGKLPDANGEYYSKEWASKHPEYLDADGNPLKGHDAANIAMRKGGDFLKQELDTPESKIDRTGGDELNGADAARVADESRAAAERASSEYDGYIRGLGLHELSHPKNGGMPTGVGMDVGAADHVVGRDPMATSGSAGADAEDAKQQYLRDVSNRDIDAGGNRRYIEDETRAGRWKENSDYVHGDGEQAGRLGQADTRGVSGDDGQAPGGTPEAPKPAPTPEPVTPKAEPPKKPPPPKAGAKPKQQPKQKERSFPKTAEKKGRPGGTSRLYTPKSNVESIKNADAVIRERGWEGAEQWVKSDESSGSEKTVVAMRLIDHYQSVSNKAGTGNPARADAAMSKAIEIATETSVALTKAGQEIQAARVFGRLLKDPAGVLVAGQRRLDQINKTRPDKRKLVLQTKDAKELQRLAKIAQTWDTLDKETKQVLGVLERVVSSGELTSSDVESLKLMQTKIHDAVGSEPVPLKGKAKKPSLNKMLQGRLNTMAAERMDKYKKSLTQAKTRAGLPGDEMADLAIIGAAKLGETGLKFGEWSKSMMGDLDERVQPHLQKIYRRARKVLKTERARTQALWEQATAVDRLVKRIESDESVPQEMFEHLKERTASIEELTGDARTEAILEVQQTLELLKPPKFWRRVSALQTIAQLLNVKTLGRNVIGNSLMQAAERVIDLPATAIDIGVSRVTGERSVTLGKGGTHAFEEMYKGFMKGARRSIKGLPTGDVSTKFQIQGAAFRGKGAEGPFKYAEKTLGFLEKALGVSLGATDRAVYETVKNQLVGEIAELAAINNKVPKADRKAYVQDFMKNAPDAAIELAHQYGKYVTFQDDNFLSEGAVALKKLLNAKKDFGVGDLVLKYPKTPANLLARALEYSPAGMVKSMYHLGRAVAGHEFNQREFVRSLTRAVVGGGGLTGMGYAMYNMGIITGDAENYNVTAFEREQTGGGPYRVNVSGLKRWVFSGFTDAEAAKKRKDDMLVSYDWAQPLAISLSLGANIAQARQERAFESGDYGAAFDNTVDAFSGGAQSIAETPALAGLQTLFGRGVPGDEGKQYTRALARVFEQAPASFVPTFVYQVRQAMDNTAREKHDPNTFKRALNNVINKLPFVEKMLPEAYNTLGLDKKQIFKSGSNSLFNVFLNPAFVTKYDVDPMIEMVLTPYEAERRTGQIPRRAPRKLTFSKKDAISKLGVDPADVKELAKIGASKAKDRIEFNISGEERAALQKYMAELLTRQFRRALKRQQGATGKDAWKNKSPEVQEKILAKHVSFVGEMARQQFLLKKLGKIKAYSVSDNDLLKE